MRHGKHVSVIIPALDEELSIAAVLGALPGWLDHAIVVDNGSTDNTAAVATEHGAQVISEGVRGYGRACLSGIAALEATDVVVFLDADFSDDPTEMDKIVDPVAQGNTHMVVGHRVPVPGAVAAITLAQRVGNGLACFLIRLIWGHRYRDLGPFRAIDRAALEQLGMADQGYGWTIEMQIKAIEAGLSVVEVPVSYRDRIGVSKISGTVRGTLGAALKIMWTIAIFAVRSRRR
jgi:glycosyltransferase involved in cell wall biosynthesis